MRGTEARLQPVRGIGDLAKTPKRPKATKPATVAAPPVAPPAQPAPPTDGVRGLRRLLVAATGARLCYGDPVRVGERTVIPFARGLAAGGFGRGGPGGGSLTAEPLGIDVTTAGARFEPVGRARSTGRMPGAGLAVAAAAGVAVSALLRRGRRPLLPP